ncbi:alpha/beta fold hydrolase [Ktedonobacter racemifer]|uniref:Alpha/beta hydrolase fold protein n=1 Tax=Ktedonobacter racemifer DSM 44963 TaxID=485913 RepID=D6TC80_KTERA|nr:alpha/beta hydrolase [Ktedonobacter racemifer]EFH88116.1 alpha/beta hydrolase fold protein [Ktedonobacter racemifer DSM 44963]
MDATRQKLKIITRSVEVEGYPIHYRVIGEDMTQEAVILVHGLSGSTLWWTHNIFALAQDYRVYLIDLPGFGTMRRLARQFTLANATTWLLAWMKAVGIERAHLVGHSMGGYICMHLAATYPERVMRMILVSPAVQPQFHSILGYMRPLILSTRYVRPTFLPLLLYDALRAGPRLLLRTTHDLILLDLNEELSIICQPTLLVWGEHDIVIPLTTGIQLLQTLPNAQLLILQKAGHVSMFDRPLVFNQATLAFLQGDLVGS